jgi:hypothetical protein
MRTPRHYQRYAARLTSMIRYPGHWYETDVNPA